MQDKRESDMKLREALGQIEKANHSYQMVWNMKTGLEEKQNKSSEQKKILVKEVKQLRKRIEESDDLNDQISVVNDKLIAVTNDLRQQVETQRSKIDTQNAAILASTDTALHEAMRSSGSTEKLNELSPDQATVVAAGDSGGGGEVKEEVTVVADKLLEEARALTEKSTQAHQHQHQSTPSHHTSSSSSSTLHSSTTSTDTEGAGGRGNDIEQLLNDRTQSGSSLNTSLHHASMSGLEGDIVTRGGRTSSMEWNFPSETSSNSMLNMEWLSPEQRQLAEQRQHQGQQTGGGNGMESSAHNLTGGDGMETGKSSGSGLTSKPEKRSSIAMFKNAFSKVSHSMLDSNTLHVSESNESTAGTTSTLSHVPENQTTGDNEIPSSSISSSVVPDQPSTFIDATYENGGKPTCFRCGGTVEGPKYSTCKCAIPAMSPLTEEELDKEDHGMQALKGFFKKSTSKAGDFASVARRKSLAVGKDLFHHNNSNSVGTNNNKDQNNTAGSIHGGSGGHSDSGGNGGGSSSSGSGSGIGDFHLFSSSSETTSSTAPTAGNSSASGLKSGSGGLLDLEDTQAF